MARSSAVDSHGEFVGLCGDVYRRCEDERITYTDWSRKYIGRSHEEHRSSCCSHSRRSGWSMYHWDVSFPMRCRTWSCGGFGVSAAVVIVPAILLTGTKATGFVVVPLSRPTSAIIVAICVIRATPRICSMCLGRIFPDMTPLRLNQFSKGSPVLLQCEQVTTAEGVGVTTMPDSRLFVVHEDPFHIALFAYKLRIVISTRSSVKPSSTSALFSFCRYLSTSPSSTMSSMLSSLNTSPFYTSSSLKQYTLNIYKNISASLSRLDLLS